MMTDLVALNAPPVVLEISQRAQVLIMLATQLVFEALDFRRLVPARAIFVLLWRFHGKIVGVPGLREPYTPCSITPIL